MFDKSLIADFREMVKNSQKIAVISDRDIDGVVSAILIKNILKRFNKDFILRLLKERGRYLEFVTQLDLRNYDLLIFLDIPFEDKEINIVKRKFDGNIIIIDHHKEYKKEAKILPIFNTTISTSSIVYHLGKRLFEDFAKYSWIACIGAASDYLLQNDEELVKDFKERYPYLFFNSAFFVLFLLIKYLDPNFIINNILELGDVSRIFNSFMVLQAIQAINKFKDNILKVFNSKKIYSSKKLLVLKVRGDISLSIFSRLNPDKIVVAIWDRGGKYIVSLRGTNLNVNLGKFLEEFTKKYGIRGGGHPEAAGGLIYKENLEKLIKELENLV